MTEETAADEAAWLKACKTTVTVAMPKVSGLVRAHAATIPAQRRKEKRILTEAGIALCLFARLAFEHGWYSPWLWGACFFFGANYIAGDYRRLLMRAAFGSLSDAATFLTEAASRLRQIKEAWAELLPSFGKKK